MGSTQSKLITCSNEICSHEPINKFQLIDYSCHELLHTWSPSCTQVNAVNFKQFFGYKLAKIIHLNNQITCL